ncbi:LOW QUALITY PROTEIN: hypothetical protein HID58_028904 [Brassica napus]|uniref:DUF1985 domain-containing protein n=1 Tax=Brassica napus TaxID=3708 RepID=A0ABQ8CBP5_BRANA|nr:LOW QUALITY PROTEIN: hypothetical protein HID58_028904 [Brassica napus]
MVASQLVKFSKDLADETNVSLPKVMFADSEEPCGVRVLTYQSLREINTILTKTRSIVIVEKPVFSRRFGRFLLSRQLNAKKQEAWFRLAKKHIRFSLRKFSIVTDLLAVTSQETEGKNINEKPYWSELFGSVEEMRVLRDVKMMKMLKEHAELLGDIDEFFAFPWDVLFLLVVQEACSSSESESDHNEIDCLVSKTKKKSLNLAHALEVDRKTEVLVRSIIPQDPKRLVDESLFVLADEVTDIKVEKLLSFIHANDVFSKDMFKGGKTKFDVEKMPVEVMFKAFKAESFLPLPPNAQSAAQAQHSTPPRGNDYQIIMEILSQYSTHLVPLNVVISTLIE